MAARTTFGQRLQALRLAAGITQQALAKAAGLPLGSLRGYEQEKRDPLWYVIFQLAKALAVSGDRFADCVPLPAKKPTSKGKPGTKKSRRGQQP